MSYRFATNLLPAVLLLVAGSGSFLLADTIATGYLFVTDYGTSELDRYEYTLDENTGTITGITAYGIGGNTSNAFFLGGSSNPVKEGVEGTADDLIVVEGAHGSTETTIDRYTLDGTLIGQIPINLSSYNGGNVGIGNVVVTPDGRYMYAPLETAGVIVKVDLTDGAIVASYSFSDAHDIAIAPNGDIYAANYSSGSASVIVLDSNLNFVQTLLTSSNAGAGSSFHPTGLTFAPDGSLYVDNNLKGGPDSVLHYTVSGSPGTLTATLNLTSSYIGSVSNDALEFTFGNNVGPDGNVYIAALGGGGTGDPFSSPSGYVNGVYEFDPTTGSMELAIAGFTNISGPVGSSGLSAPKYLQFDTNFVKVDDAGLVPEPASLLLVGLGLAGVVYARSRLTAPVPGAYRGL